MQFDLLGKAVRRFRLPIVDYVNAPVVIVPVQEGDVNSRYFEISLYDDLGDVDLSIYTSAMLSGATPSGVVLTSKECRISDDNRTIVIGFGGGFTARAGRVACDILLTNADNTVALTTQTFYVIVSESQSGKIITENEAEYNELLKLLNEITALEDKIERAEADRVKVESARVNAEKNRVTAETARKTAETKRVTQENTRQTNEQSRSNQEGVRYASENSRNTAEQGRVNSETARAAAEEGRVTAEAARANAEATRQANETTRGQNETNRINAENARETAETARANGFATAKVNCETATKNANDAAQNVRDLLDELPCPTNIVDGETTTAMSELRFVAL